MSLALAQKLLADTLGYARAHNFRPMGVVVLDARCAVRALATEDDTPPVRWKVAFGKANSAVTIGYGSRRIAKNVAERPSFAGTVGLLVDGGLLPSPGGVLVRNSTGRVIGAIGVSGDSSENDEAAAISAIKMSGLIPDNE